jgi:hypothetical protein
MTAQFKFGMGGAAWPHVFNWCRWLLIGWVGVVFVAAFFAMGFTVLWSILFGAPVGLGALLVGVVALVCGKFERRRWPQIALLVACPLVAASIGFTNWPMRLSFAASTPALDRLAQQVAAGQTPSLPTRAGAYVVRAVQTEPVSGGVAVCLWTKPQYGHIGFVQSPVGVTPPFNRWTHTKLSSQWHHFGED